ncbi:tRNA (5-methoxyuridine) 34 synthase [Salmonella enterica subsp. arizonae]|uniref:tRNA (5-methoxyuridine) 34 synthase n=1 Tax=Salmonella enterica subsp. arizonae TaxID=59203 RepID=A0A379TAU9_SALER|nr:tRNA (5-methoxyuridine) 34 synthase [Salmonella enterica subsp. arizonae]
MIEFGNFYQLIAKNHLSHWLEILPAQIAGLATRATAWFV